jgi:fatty acid-binding protein DegV
MSSIAIITDTDSSLPAEVAARQESFETGVDINDARLFARVDREGKLPTTAAPAPGKFAEAYQAAFDAGAETVICFCVSGEVSATYSAAVNARDLLPERDITVVDSRSLSMGQGFMVLAAAEAAQAGASKDEIVARTFEGERGWFPRVPRVPKFRVQEEQVHASLPCPDDVLTAELTSGLSVHSGAGLVGVVVVAGS